MAKRLLHRSRHPFDIHPFEAFSHGSWRTIEFVRIEDGRVVMSFENLGFEMDEKVSNGTLRIRSRKATLSDCTCFLRPGVDICVLLTDPTNDSDQQILQEWLGLSSEVTAVGSRGLAQNPKQVVDPTAVGSLGAPWVKGLLEMIRTQDIPDTPVMTQKMTFEDFCVCITKLEITLRGLHHPAYSNCPHKVRIDAKIKSIERRPHESQCTCRFHVIFNTTRLPHAKRKLGKVIRDVGIDHIAIIQQLQRKPCKDGYYRWSYSRDCPFADEAKLFRGQFSSDISWLLVSSILKELKFDIRSVQSKIVYQIMYDDHDVCSSDPANNVAINFQMDNGILRPFTRTFILLETLVSGHAIEAGPVHDLKEDDSLQFYDPMELRRSKRRNIQPERFVSYGGFSKAKPSIDQIETDKIDRWEDNRTLSIILHQADDGHLMHSESFRWSIEGEQMVEDGMDDYWKNCPMLQSNVKSRNFMSGAANRMENQILLLDNHQMDKVTAAAYDRLEEEEGLFTGVAHSSFSVYVSRKNKRMKSPFTNCNVPNPRASSDICPTSESVSLLHPQDYLPIKILGNPVPKVARVFSKHGHRHGSYTMGERTKSGERFREMQEKGDRKMKVIWRVKGSNMKHLRRIGNLFCSERDRSGETSRRKSSLSTIESKEMIERFIKTIESEIKKEHPHAAAQWETMQAMNNQRWRDKCRPPLNDQAENSELEVLWKEMELAMATDHFVGESQGSRFCDEVLKKSSKDDGHSCQHEFKLNEEIGLVCQLCRFVSTEIRDISLPFMQTTGWVANKELHDGEELRSAKAGHEDLDIFWNPGSSKEIPLSKRSDNVWALIPEFRMKLHLHQKKAFEFLWKNIAGSLTPAEMEQRSKRTGGCVVSHSPGAGKTLVVIAFLVSYLKMFPGKRPLILAPKTTLYTWYKEMKKWDISFPVYQIHVQANFRHRMHNHIVEESVGDRRPNQCDQHVMDCLDKLKKWHEHPSILLMGYTSFLSLTRDGSKYEHRRYIGRILKQSPGILILDEGHNPRSTKSRLRKALMKLKTDLRILLSGTLFQNNFTEYFNTLCLARPIFVYEVLRKLDPNAKYRKGRKGPSISMEKLARRFFIEKIGKKIKSKVEEERRRGLRMLRKITNRFIDVYEGGVQDSLPGLQSYTLLMKSTVIQQDILTRLQNQKVAYKGYPLELELLITLGSVHPWLIKTVGCVDRYFTMEELQDLEKHRLDLEKGSKVRFVVSLVQKCIMKMEKVLIFSHNIAPITLFVQIFEMIFGWQLGEEILVLQGDQELYERARVMDKFDESEGPSRVLLASTTACAEGISLTAASRVVLLDSEWNPSKTKQAIARAFRPGQERVVYVYQLLASGTLEEEKHGKTTWKEWVSSMIFSDATVDDPSHKQVENIDDDVLREIVEDQAKIFHMIMKHDKLSNGLDRGKAATLFPGK